MSIIRPATVDDAPGIAQVQVESWRSTYTGLIPETIIADLTVERRERQWQHMIPLEGSVVYVAEDENGQIVGFVAGGAARDGTSGYTGELFAIYLLASTQRGGIGRQLVQALAQTLIEHGHQSMLVWVLKTNPIGRGFYEKLGGVYVSEKVDGELVEVSYGWPDIRVLLE